MYSADLRKRYELKDPSWKYDIMPEIIEGHNVLDFVDPDIEARLEALDKEEEAMAAAAELEVQPKSVLYCCAAAHSILFKRGVVHVRRCCSTI